MKKFNKITTGFVTQTFVEQEDGSYALDNQAFIAGDDCVFENEMGEVLDNPTEEMLAAYSSYEMK